MKSGDCRSASLPISKEYRNKSSGMFEKGKRSQQSGLHGLPFTDGSDSEYEYLPSRRSITNVSGSTKDSLKKCFQKDSALPSLSSPPFTVNKDAGLNYSPDGAGSARVATRSQSKVPF